MQTSSIAKAGVILLVLRLAGVAVRYVVQPPGALPGKLAIFLSAAMYHAGALLLVIGLFVALATLLPRLKWPIAVVACLVFLVLTIAGQLDLTLTWITGEPLTPTVFRTFRGFYIIRSSEFLDPLKANLGLALTGAAAFALAGGAMAAFLVGDMRRGVMRTPTWGRQALLLALAALLMFAGAGSPWAWGSPPVEAAFAREYLGLDAVMPVRPEADVVASLRRTLGLPSGAAWLSDDYPLVYGRASHAPTPAPALSDLPDIVVVMIESLRAVDVGFMRPGLPSATPNIDALAAKSVVFPLYTSNGFPTAPSIISFLGSGWPHRRKEVVTDFVDRHFDVLPSRLADMGYDTRYIGADPHLDREHILLPRWYERAVDLVGMGIQPTDRNTMRMAIDDIKKHDETMARRPLFAFVATLSSHYTFNTPEDGEDLAVVPPGETIEGRYQRVLRYVDRHLGVLLTYLDSRPRRGRTVVVVLGDHSFYLDLSHTSGLPENDNEWTTAIINGPADLIGPPRQILEPASHVDMMPTLLALVGDKRPSASLGGDLFAPPRSGVRGAIAVRPGGVRLDRGGYAYIVDARRPDQIIVKPAFPGYPPAGPPDTVDPIALGDWTSEYSRLIERDRVWSDTFLHQPGQP
jgi:hypothetical protein